MTSSFGWDPVVAPLYMMGLLEIELHFSSFTVECSTSIQLEAVYGMHHEALSACQILRYTYFLFILALPGRTPEGFWIETLKFVVASGAYDPEGRMRQGRTTGVQLVQTCDNSTIEGRHK